MSDIVKIGNATLYHGDCMDILPTLPKVDAVVTDPPYGKVKGDFDHEWTNRAAMLTSVDAWIDGIFPTIKKNGTLWWFAWPGLAGRIEERIARRMNLLAHIVWQKPSPTGQKCRKEALRAPMPLTERIIMAEHYGADNMALGESGYLSKCDELRGFLFEPIQKYLADEWQKAGLTNKDANIATGTQMAGHWFTTTQWVLPTMENYERLREYANRKAAEVLRKDYEELRKDYEELRKDYEELRRYFNCVSGEQYSDVWSFSPPKINHGHPTEKPTAIMDHIIKLSVRESGIVLDPFMGSGTTGVSCANLGRAFIGIERERKYFDIACERIAAAQAQHRLFT